MKHNTSLRKLIARTGLPHWEKEHRNHHVLDGWSWNTVVWFKGGKIFASESSNGWPG